MNWFYQFFPWLAPTPQRQNNAVPTQNGNQNQNRQPQQQQGNRR